MLAAMYKIGEFARLSQVPIRTLRYYDHIGVLVPAQVAPSGYRGYAAEQLEQLNRILVLKDLGLSLDEIRTLLADRATLADLRAVLRDKHAELERRVDAERRRLARAAARLALLETGCAASPDIALRVTAPQWIGSLRATVRTHDDCDALFDELDHELRRAGRGGRDRQCGAIWHACAPGEIDCEVFEILPGPREARGRIAVREEPARRVAALVYRGDTDYLPAYGALRAWIRGADLAITGPKRELFLRSPTAVTEIQFPIARAAAAAAHRPTPTHRAARRARPT
jgi:DNA-binding transcriptional MerR regulator